MRPEKNTHFFFHTKHQNEIRKMDNSKKKHMHVCLVFFHFVQFWPHFFHKNISPNGMLGTYHLWVPPPDCARATPWPDWLHKKGGRFCADWYCWWQPEIRSTLTSWVLGSENPHYLRRVLYAPSKRWLALHQQLESQHDTIVLSNMFDRFR